LSCSYFAHASSSEAAVMTVSSENTLMLRGSRPAFAASARSASTWGRMTSGRLAVLKTASA